MALLIAKSNTKSQICLAFINSFIIFAALNLPINKTAFNIIITNKNKFT